MFRLFIILLMFSSSILSIASADTLTNPLGTLSVGTQLILKSSYNISANCEDCNLFGKECTFHPPQILNYETQILANHTLVVSGLELYNTSHSQYTQNDWYMMKVTFQSGAYLLCTKDLTIQKFIDSMVSNVTVVIPAPKPVNY